MAKSKEKENNCKNLFHNNNMKITSQYMNIKNHKKNILRFNLIKFENSKTIKYIILSFFFACIHFTWL